MQNLNTILNDLKKNNFNPVTHGAVVAIIKNTEGKYLIIQRSSLDEDGARLWDFAGGSCDSDDVQLDCEREVLEEVSLNLNSDVLKFHKHINYICPWKNEEKVSFIFVAEGINSEDIILSEEHDSYAWVTYEEMLGYEFYKKNLPKLVFEMFVATSSDLAYWKDLVELRGYFNDDQILLDDEQLIMQTNFTK